MALPINILTVIVLVYFIICGRNGYKKGLVRGMVRIITYLLGFAALYILLKGLSGIIQGNALHIIMALILLTALGLVRKLTKLILDSCKLVSMLPVIHWLDKLAGAVLGITEGVFVVWTLFAVLGYFNFFGMETLVMKQIETSRLLTILYHSNYVIYFLAKL